MRNLGRIAPPDWQHVDRYPLTAEVTPTVPVPLIIGVNWYSAFDNPVRDSRGSYWIGRDGNLGQIRGGHCVALKHRGVADLASWWTWYNQIAEGICVSEGVSRAMTLLNRERYQPRPLYDECKQRDGIPNEEGTFVRTGLEVARDLGLVRPRRNEKHWTKTEEVTHRDFNLIDGIQKFRWVRSIDDALGVIGYGDKDYVDILNSWGRDYPHLVRMPASVLDRLFQEDGELGVITDR